jgi:hypothetical protein
VCVSGIFAVIFNHLDSRSYGQTHPSRTDSKKELEKLGEVAEPFLREALDRQPSLEAQSRIQRLIDGLREFPSTDEDVRAVRAIEALEHMATPEAMQVLESLAGGAAGAHLTREAKAAVHRKSGHLNGRS